MRGFGDANAEPATEQRDGSALAVSLLFPFLLHHRLPSKRQGETKKDPSLV